MIENLSPSAFDDGRAVPGLGGPEEGLGGRSGEEPRFSEVGGIVQKLHTVGSDCE